jgi:hypothetical protein
MARKRMIDPSFWVDEKLGTVDPVVRLLFMGLISQADDEGRLNGHPSLIKSLIFPYDHSIQVNDVDEWLNLLSLEERKLIQRYEVDHQKYILITNFKKHQTINKPQKSKLPPLLESYGSPTVVVSEQSGIATAQSKLIEVNRSEGNVSEGNEPEHSTFNHPIKDRIYKYAKKCELKGFNIVSADDLFYYIEKVEIEVIEEALKKSFKNHLNYATKIINDWVAEGKTKIEQINPKPKAGESSEKHQGEREFGRDPSSTSKGKTEAIGWLPSSAKPANYSEMLEVSGQ